MKVAFRADASLVIGSGHVMRCLTLADALRDQGAECFFLSRDHDGHMHSTVEARGFKVLRLGGATPPATTNSPAPPYSDWLGVDSQRDAEDSLKKLTGLDLNWLVVDHYGIDAHWERSLRRACKRLLAIDDLANRDHAVDVLLDQNLGKTDADYDRRVPAGCTVLAGPQFALLRSEFAELRAESISRRGAGSLRNLLITMGGVDLNNATGAVLDALSRCPPKYDLEVTVVLGSQSPWRDSVIHQGRTTPFQVEVLVNAQHMAQLMLDADLAIGAAGSTSWERCCMGLPTLQLVIAKNQRPIATALTHAGAAQLMSPETLEVDIQHALDSLIKDPGALLAMSKAAASVADGLGTQRVVQNLMECSCV